MLAVVEIEDVVVEIVVADNKGDVGGVVFNQQD